jgi:MFS family permease
MAETARISPFAIFRNRNFRLMWTGQLVSTIGTALTSLAASIYVFRLTDSALSVGLMLMATAAPSLLVGLFAGVFVDRYDRRMIMVVCAGLRLAGPDPVPGRDRRHLVVRDRGGDQRHRAVLRSGA